MSDTKISALTDGTPLVAGDQLVVARGNTNVKITAPAAWAAVAFTNGWSNLGGGFATVQYFKDITGRVFLKGAMTGGTLGIAAFTLPVGFRPSDTRVFPCVSNSAFGFCTIDSLGAVAGFGNNAYVAFDGVNFLV